MPGAVARLAELGVHPDGVPFRGIRYLDGRCRADAPFRHGAGLGVRRTTLHAALSARAAALAIPVLPARITKFAQDGHGVAAAGLRARYLVAADGLHSGIRRACGLDPRPAAPATRQPRHGLRRHYRLAPWADMVEVYWAAGSEAYVTPVAAGLVGVAVLGGSGSFDERLAAFPALLERLAGAAPGSSVRGAGPLRQDVRQRVAGRVLLVGDASGYLDALTGEGIGMALAQAAALADCVAACRPGDYERAWQRASRRARVLTSALLWSRNQPLLAPRIVPAARRLPWLFTGIVSQVAKA